MHILICAKRRARFEAISVGINRSASLSSIWPWVRSLFERSFTAVAERTRDTVKTGFGRHLFGVAAFFFGVVGLLWHDFNSWQQLQTLWNVPLGPTIIHLAALFEILGGVAIQFRRTARYGALLLGAVYLFFALRWFPLIFARPLVYDRWGNFFEQFSLVSGGLIVYAGTMQASARTAALLRLGQLSFAICVISFTLEQALYLEATASFVPSWLPPNQMFWAVLTTIAFALAAIALLSGRQATLAAGLLTAMIFSFGLLIWIPLFITSNGAHGNWGGVAQNFLICGAAWISFDSLRSRLHPRVADG